MTSLRTFTDRPAARFAFHYAEMVLVMLAGMTVLGMPLAMALSGLGIEAADDAPAAMLLGMGLSMTVPMVGWMRYRGHGWPASNEMAASMMVPTFGAMALLGLGLVEDTDALLAIQHVVMFPAMLAVMLRRRDEYTHAHVAR